MTYKELRTEYNLMADSCDPWGSAMEFMFECAGQLSDRGAPIPAEWEYKPSPFGGSDPESFWCEVMLECDDDTLLRAGAVFHRYTRLLDHLGKSY
jgi:hypothetical protein